MNTGIRGKVAAAIVWAARACGALSRSREGEGWSCSACWAIVRESEMTSPEGRMIVGTV
jgi:hypothetical protein